MKFFLVVTRIRNIQEGVIPEVEKEEYYVESENRKELIDRCRRRYGQCFGREGEEELADSWIFARCEKEKGKTCLEKVVTEVIVEEV